MDLAELLQKERRARLAAEQLAEQRQRELHAANEKLALHARALAGQIAAQRRETASARSEAEALKDQNSRFLHDLERAHTAAVMAERRLWDSVNAIHDGFAVFDADHRLVMANSAFLSPFAAHPGIAPGIPYPDILRIGAEAGVIETGDTSPAEWAGRIYARLQAEPIEPATLRLASGHTVRLVDRRGRGGDLVTLALDMTGQMRLDTAIDVLPDGFVMFDRDDRLIMANRKFHELFPEMSAAARPGATFEEIVRYGLARGQFPEAIGHEGEWLAKRLEQRRNPPSTMEVQVADGRWLRIVEQATPDGGIVGLRVDITELKAQQAALEAARIEAEAANRAKSAFLANMSHEIRTPMNGVVGMAELLCDTALTEEQRMFAETIRSSGEALLVIINDILDFSKIEAERMILHPEPFDLERVIHEVAMLLQPRARQKGIDLLIDFDMFLPTRYMGDPGRLRQVLTNLAGNAVKFTESGHVLIRVTGIETAPGLRRLHVTVEDTGIGIAPGHLDHIFGEFNQVEAATSRRYDGTGLGLAIARRLIERMEGRIWVESEPGHGTCFGFCLTLPVSEDSPADPGMPILLRRALVVDDQFINRTILERQLDTAGIAVTLCRSGAEALAALAGNGDFDVLLTDHEMPGMDGLALARAVRAAGHRLPVVLLSSNPAGAREGEGAAALAAILQKPLLRSELFRRLQDLSVPDAAATPEPPDTPRAMRVLTAEDNRTNRLVFRKMVRDLDIELMFAGNGLEVLDLWRGFRPDIIFMDISMPGMDGHEATRTIRAAEAETRAHVPVIALTAHRTAGGATDPGFDRHMTKPLRKAAIVEAIEAFHPPDCRPVLPAGG